MFVKSVPQNRGTCCQPDAGKQLNCRMKITSWKSSLQNGGDWFRTIKTDLPNCRAKCMLVKSTPQNCGACCRTYCFYLFVYWPPHLRYPASKKQEGGKAWPREVSPPFFKEEYREGWVERWLFVKSNFPASWKKEEKKCRPGTAEQKSTVPLNK